MWCWTLPVIVMYFPGKCILTSMQSTGEKHRGIIIIIIFNVALGKTMVHSFRLWILIPIFTVTSLVKGKGLPNELRLYTCFPLLGDTLRMNSAPCSLCHALCHGSARKPHGMACILPKVLSQACRAGLQVPVCSARTLKKPLWFFLRVAVCCRALGYNYVPQ